MKVDLKMKAGKQKEMMTSARTTANAARFKIQFKIVNSNAGITQSVPTHKTLKIKTGSVSPILMLPLFNELLIQTQRKPPDSTGAYIKSTDKLIINRQLLYILYHYL